MNTQSLLSPAQGTTRAATPNAPYSRRPPSPPYIPIPLTPRCETGLSGYTVAPCEDNLEAIGMTEEELYIVTRNKAQTAVDLAATWSYEMRRQIQPIVDYLCIGPTSVVRDHACLQKNNVTMVVVVRDARMGTHRLPSVDKASEACGIESYYLNVESVYQLIRDLPEIIRSLNAHMIKLHNQGQGDSMAPRVGNILVTCDTGSDRSAAIVAAYMMAVFGASMHKIVQFISVQRFCCTFDEDIKRMLQTWQDILRAKASVTSDSRSTVRTALTFLPQPPKRGLDDMLGSEMDVDEGGAPMAADTDRFIGRDKFVPFADAA